MKVTETSLLLALSQWLDVETVLLPSSSVGLFSGNAEKENVKMRNKQKVICQLKMYLCLFC